MLLQQVSFWPDEDLYSSPRSPSVEDDRLSIASQLRKTKSMDASCLDMRSINDATSPMKPLSRAKSDFNLTASTNSLVHGKFHLSSFVSSFFPNQSLQNKRIPMTIDTEFPIHVIDIFIVVKWR